jgi:hypothetical protein
MPAAAQSPPPKITFSLQPKQHVLLKMVNRGKATWIGFGGSRGGSKSRAARDIMLFRRIILPGTRGCILRKTYDLVRENQIEPLLAERPELREFYYKQDAELRIPLKDARGKDVISTIAFRYADDTKSVEGMIGKEYYDFVVDQAEMFTESELLTMQSCVRWPGASLTQCKFILTFNPGGIGMPFLKRIFNPDKSKRSYKPEEINSAKLAGLEVSDNYEFIQAYGWDNIQWSKEALIGDGYHWDCAAIPCLDHANCARQVYYSWSSDKRFDYYVSRTQEGIKQNSYPPARRIGWLLGSMDKFAGQFFDIFNLPPHDHIRTVIPMEWDARAIGIDWGYGHNASVHWGAQVKPNLLSVYREKVINGLSAGALAQLIVDLTPEDERPFIRKIGLSHDAYSHRDERDTQAALMTEVFTRCGLPAPHPAGKEVPGTSMAIYEAFRADEVVIDPRCTELIKTLPLIKWDDEKETVTPFLGDDPYASLRHLFQHRVDWEPQPEGYAINARAQMIVDPINAWMYRLMHKPAPPQAVIEVNYAPAWWQNGGE